MKKFVASILAAAMALTMVACGGSPSSSAPAADSTSTSSAAPADSTPAESTPAESASSEAAAPTAKTITKIGVSINATSNENNRAMFEAAQAEIKAHGYECVATNADGVLSKQAQDIENLISQGCDAIILINADKDVTGTLVQQARDAGIIVATYAGGFIQGNDLHFELNNFKISSEMFMILAAEMGFKGNIIQCYDPTSGACRMRYNAQEAILAEYTDIVTVNEFATIYPGTVADTATKTEAALLANPEVNAIWGVEDLVSLGALQACEALGRDDVIMIGIDGEPDVLAHIANGAKQIKATAIGDNEQGMRECVESIEKLANGEAVSLFQEIPYVVITPENVNDYYTPAQ